MTFSVYKNIIISMAGFIFVLYMLLNDLIDFLTDSFLLPWLEMLDPNQIIAVFLRKIQLT